MANLRNFGSVKDLLGVAAGNSKCNFISIPGKGVKRVTNITVSYNHTNLATDPATFRGGRLIVIEGELISPDLLIEPVDFPLPGTGTGQNEQRLGRIIFDATIWPYGEHHFTFGDECPLYSQADQTITIIQTVAYLSGDVPLSPSTFLGRLSVIGETIINNESTQRLKVREL